MDAQGAGLREGGEGVRRGAGAHGERGARLGVAQGQSEGVCVAWWEVGVEGSGVPWPVGGLVVISKFHLLREICCCWLFL